MLSARITERLHGIPTPFYLYDMELLERTLEALTRASARHGYEVHYALKANFEPRICELVRRYGLGVDCVSGNEVRFAIENGFPASKVVYAGVGKSDGEITYGLQQGIFAFNCESRQEVGVINDLAAGMGRVADIALRINPDVDPHSHRYISTGQADSKFGISYREIAELTTELDGMANVRVVGLHFHIGSQIRNMQVFEKLCLRFQFFMAIHHAFQGGIDGREPCGQGFGQIPEVLVVAAHTGQGRTYFRALERRGSLDVRIQQPQILDHIGIVDQGVRQDVRIGGVAVLLDHEGFHGHGIARLAGLIQHGQNVLAQNRGIMADGLNGKKDKGGEEHVNKIGGHQSQNYFSGEFHNCLPGFQLPIHLR